MASASKADKGADSSASISAAAALLARHCRSSVGAMATNLSAADYGKDLARRPRDSASLSADYAFRHGPSFGATVQAVGHSYDDAGNLTRLNGYTLVGIRAEMPLGERFALYGRIDNLFDERYQTVAGYGTQGRAAYAGIRVKLD